ncbi:SDR family NAD(P)-dependent oxidoreductase [Planomonospora corallina]|uniref:SDR family NAD(P)-dependent oxidoreductase n=1 Tax=Planomonospora corallina TaxID=1806052 RepID=A0ABV8IJR6_9ACTN
MSSTPTDLRDRVAIVTGAGSGIGRAMALALAGAGARVVVADIAAEPATGTVKLVQEAEGAARAAVLDVGDEAMVGELVRETVEDWGRIDILCNNAGIIDNMALPAEMSTATWDRVLRVNLTGPFLLTRAVLPQMLAQGGGSIVNTASEAGLRGGAAGVAYTASKHGVVGLTRNVAWAYARSGIRCNAICPGPTETSIAESAAVFDPRGIERLGPVLGLGEIFAKPQDMAAVALFLASDAARLVNGAIIPVDGGWLAG